MKKTNVAQPNYRLKQAREIRGWSQHDVAQHLDAERYYVSRWERGVILPSPHYRQQLCALFGKNAEELGFVADKDLESDDLATMTLPIPIYDPTIPLPAQQYGGLVGRHDLLHTLKERLLTTEHHQQLALQGLPGSGKTALALELAYDPDIRAQFPGGILWASVGQEPHTRKILSRWGVLLGLAPHVLGELSDSHDWFLALRMAMGSRKMLLIIDDVWSFDDAMAYVAGGIACAHVITTRLPDVAQLFAPTTTMHVNELSDAEGFHLLEQLAPAAVALDRHDAQTLAHVVGGLPLTLTLIGNYLRIQSHGQQHRRIRQAMRLLQCPEQRFVLTNQWTPAGPHLTTLAGPSRSLKAAIDLSAKRLDEAALAALHALAIFPPKPLSFSEEAAIFISNASTTVLDMLSDSGLLESAEPGRYTLHQAIREYMLRSASQAPITQERLITFYVAFLEEHRDDFGSIEQEGVVLSTILQLAQKLDMQAAFLRGVGAYIPFLHAHGFYAHALDYATAAESLARAREDYANMLTMLLYKGIVLERMGEYACAENALQEGITLADSVGNVAVQGKFLRHSGLLAEKRGDYTRACAAIEAGLSIARKLGQAELLAALLLSQGALAGNRGDSDQAEAAYLEGLQLVRDMRQDDLMCQFLASLGLLADNRGATARAEEFLQAGLALARQIGNRELIARCLTNLAVAAGRSGDLSLAEKYLQDGLALVRQMGFREQHCLLLLNLAELYKRQAKYEFAEQTLQEAESLAKQLGHQRLISALLLARGELFIATNRMEEATAALEKVIAMTEAVSQNIQLAACFALAKISAINGSYAAARQQGKAVYMQFSQLGHGKAQEVRTWLEQLPSSEPPPAPDIQQREW